MSKIALVTGASGFVGSHLCNRLMSENWKVIAIGTHNENNPTCDVFYACNLQKIPWDLISDIDVCFHQAANNDTTDFDVDSMFNSNFFDSCDLFYKLVKRKKMS